MKITFSSTAKTSLEEIILFLKRKWTQREINVLKNDIKQFRKTINEGFRKIPENKIHISRKKTS